MLAGIGLFESDLRGKTEAEVASMVEEAGLRAWGAKSLAAGPQINRLIPTLKLTDRRGPSRGVRWT